MNLMELFNYYYNNLADPRVKDRYFFASIWFTIIIIVIYLIVSFKLIPDYMKNRPAYKLNIFIKFYNIFQVATNAYVVKELSICYPFHRAFECRPITFDMDDCSMRIVNGSVITILLKLIDLSETVIYLLRKKNNQVSFLHLYHHISTFLVGIIYLRYFTSEVSMLFPIMNCGVHVIMYFYYFLSNFPGQIKQMIIPLKRYMTLIQMGQLFLMLIQVIFFLLQDCGLSRVILYMTLFNTIINFGLFFQFYRKTYINSKKKKIN